MNALETLMPLPRLRELNSVEVDASPSRVWRRLRHEDFVHSPVLRAVLRGLVAAHELPARLHGGAHEPSPMNLDALHSTPEHPGFSVLADDGAREVVVGAVGKVWQSGAPYEYVADGAAFAAFSAPGVARVALGFRVVALADERTRVELELRVDATDEPSWQSFERSFWLLGAASRFLRRSGLAALRRELGAPGAHENERALPGDELLASATEQLTDSLLLAASPAQIWPWLVQLGCRRGGFYAFDLLVNDAQRSAREVHPELQALAVGDVLPATTGGSEGFEVLRVEPEKLLALGGLFGGADGRQLPFDSGDPEHFWRVSWTFVLVPVDARHTRLYVRSRASYSSDGTLRALWIRPVHWFMERAQLENLAARVEYRLPLDDSRDVLEGIVGAARMVLALMSPELRDERQHWGLEAESAARALPGDELVTEPNLSWTHGIEIEAPASAVWPWIAQLGVGRAGFYSYQWLENLVGCQVHNSEVVHPEWAVRAGDHVTLHPEMPPLTVVAAVADSHLVLHGAPDATARSEGRPWVDTSWVFALERLGPQRCRMYSRMRSNCSDDLKTRATSGPMLLEPVGYVMDRRMLAGIKERAEGAHAPKLMHFEHSAAR